MVFLIVLIVLITYFLLHNFYLKRLNLPPGPVPMPFIGNLLDLLSYPPGEDIQLEWSKKYGGVYTFWIGVRPIVAISDYKLIVDTFQREGDAFNGRAQETEYITLIKGGVFGVISVEGDIWRDQRRFSLRVLRDFGLGKNVLQEQILDEIQTLMSRINIQIDQSGRPFAVDELVDISVGSIINSILFGYRYSDERITEFNDLKRRAQNFVRLSGHPMQRLIRDYPQFYKHLPYFKQKVQELKSCVDYLHDFFRTRIEEHMKELKEFDLSNTPPTDLVMAFIQEWNRREQAGEVHHFSHQQLIVLLFDLWIAGQETTSNTLQCFLAHLIHNPEIERKAHKELDSVIKSDRMITLADKANLPYINAIVQETQRMANLLPINLLHRTTRDVVVGKYTLKKGTCCVPQISVLLCNPEIYEHPKAFNPDRFIDDNGNLKHSPELLAFSIGKRVCLGEGLARTELFLFISNMLNQYKFSPGDQKPNLKRNHGITVRLDGFLCRPQRR